MGKKKPTKQDLKKLKRSELLEIMLAQSEEIDRLRAELAEKGEQLADKRIAIENSGSIAEASLKLTKVFMEAQHAADLYLANIKRSGGAGGHAAGAGADAGSDAGAGAPHVADELAGAEREQEHGQEREQARGAHFKAGRA